MHTAVIVLCPGVFPARLQRCRRQACGMANRAASGRQAFMASLVSPFRREPDTRRTRRAERIDVVRRQDPGCAGPAPGWLDAFAARLHAGTGAPARDAGTHRLRPILAAVERLSRELYRCRDIELVARVRALRACLRRDLDSVELIGACFALVAKALERSIGKYPYPTQLMGGWGLLQGRLVEMAGGEGKTLAAALPACVAALAGVPVHVVTANDYLAARDVASLAPLYTFFGLSVGTVLPGMDPGARRAAYGRDITYCSNQELALDYLRDRHARGARGSALDLALERIGAQTGSGAVAHRSGPLVMRGLHFAIVDEADSVFIDAARTPLILALSTGGTGLARDGRGPTDGRKPVTHVTSRRLFTHYLRLAGMTGTAREVNAEIGSVYGLEVVAIPPHRESRRAFEPPRVFATRAQKWHAVAEAVERLAMVEGRPVLIGTRSVRAADEISTVLGERGIPHALLKGRQDRDEAEVMARAGEPGRVTVAANMAGRGTDIRIDPTVAARGGLHVILTEYHESRRIDRQLFGRCGHRGDPGSCAVMVSLEDELFAVHGPAGLLLARWWAGLRGRPPRRYCQVLRHFAQWRAERKNRGVRVHTLRQDRKLDRLPAYSGRGE